MHADTLSEVLRAIRLTGGMFFRARLRAPYAVTPMDAQQMLATFAPDADHMMPFHIVTGVSTTGPPGMTFGEVTDPAQAPPYTVFMDLQDMIVPAGIAGPFSLGFGTLFLSRLVWNLNFL